MEIDIIYDKFLTSDYGQSRWNEAYENFPRYNTSQADYAADYIFDGFKIWFANENLPLTNSISEDTLFDGMYESIYAGLT